MLFSLISIECIETFYMYANKNDTPHCIWCLLDVLLAIEHFAKCACVNDVITHHLHVLKTLISLEQDDIDYEQTLFFVILQVLTK